MSWVFLRLVLLLLTVAMLFRPSVFLVVRAFFFFVFGGSLDVLGFSAFGASVAYCRHVVSSFCVLGRSGFFFFCFRRFLGCLGFFCVWCFCCLLSPCCFVLLC